MSTKALTSFFGQPVVWSGKSGAAICALNEYTALVALTPVPGLVHLRQRFVRRSPSLDHGNANHRRPNQRLSLMTPRALAKIEIVVAL
jgi:hypothetical protein